MADADAARLRELADHLPGSTHGWRKGAADIYGPDDLYRYIDGGAELYISYRFVALLSQPYLDGDGRELRLDVFDMGSPGSAFGVFCHSRQAVDRFVAPDVESEYAGGLLHFWKGRYYASMLAYPETDASRAVVRELARSLADQIDDPGRRPDLVARLPQTGRVPSSLRYFRHPAWINEFHHFSDENLLGIDAEVEVAMARYRPAGDGGDGEGDGSGDRGRGAGDAGGSGPAVVLLIRYPTAAAAEAARERLATALPAGAGEDLRQEESGGWLGCLRAEELLAVVADAPDRETALALLQACVRSGAEPEPGRPR